MREETITKRCPKCTAEFSADMRYCSQDGSLLEDHKAADNGKAKSEVPSLDDEPHLDGVDLMKSLIDDSAPAPGSITQTLNTNGKMHISNLGDPRLELLGQVVENRYEISETLGKGGMSVVFKARDRRLKKIVAIKVLMPHLSADPLSVQRFQQEATAASHLDHANIVKVYNVGATESGLPFMAMDYLEGRSLSSVIKEKGRLYYNEALNIFVQLTGALAHAHEKGVIHRDLKPSNVILANHGEETDVAKLVDFGIAKVLSTDGGTQAKLTQTGDVFGSPHYMSPEQCLGGELDERSDVYSMGCLMYEALTGRPPHTGDSTLQILHKHISETPASFKALIPEATISADLEAIVFKCLAPKRDDRIQTMRQLKSDLAKMYMEKEKSPIAQALAKLSLAWAKRPKLSQREKTFAICGVVLSSLIIAFGWTALSFFDLTTNSPWLNPKLLTWIPRKKDPITNEDKASLAFTQIDMYVKKHDDLLKSGAVSAPVMVRSLTHGGLELQQAGRLQDAVRALSTAKKDAHDLISRFSTVYVNLLFYLGRAYYEMEDYKNAAVNLEEVLNSTEWPAGDVWRADSQAMLGDCYNNMGEKEKAERCYKSALDLWKRKDLNSKFLAITAAKYGDLVMPYNTQESYKYAFNLYKKARDNWRQQPGANGQNIALCNLRIAEVLKKVDEKQKAFTCLTEADEELEKAVGEKNPLRASVMMSIADSLWEQGKHMAATKERFDCWRILRDAPTPDKV